MVIGASAIVAVLNREPKAAEVAAAIDVHLRENGAIAIAPTGIFESVIGLAKARAGARRPTPEQIARAREAVEAFITDMKIKEATVSGDTARAAIDAAASFGLTIGHAAGLNFGDCFAYATAKAYRAPLLFIGDDFTKTDIQSVLANPNPGAI